MHAALKHRGRAYYEYARAGEDVPRVARNIDVGRLTLLEWRSPDAVLDVECSKGTYVRVLAADLGERLGCGAHLAALRRTETGGFDVARAVALDRLEALDAAERRRCLLPIDVLTAHLPRLSLDPLVSDDFLHGQPVVAPTGANGVHAVFAAGGLIGVADVAEGRAQPRRVVAQEAPADSQPD
jgi:tRNA pseudouridine55 synthase